MSSEISVQLDYQCTGLFFSGYKHSVYHHKTKQNKDSHGFYHDTEYMLIRCNGDTPVVIFLGTETITLL